MGWFRRLGIRAKLTAMLMAMAISGLSVAGLLMYQWMDADRVYTSMIHKDVQAALLSLKIRGDVQNVGRQMNNVQLLRSPQGVDPLERSVNEMFESITRSTAAIEAMRIKGAADVLAFAGESVHRLRGAAVRTIAAKRDGGADHDQATRDAWSAPDGRPTVIALFERMAAFAEERSALVAARNTELSRDARWNALVVGLGVLALFGAIVGIALVAAQQTVLRPLEDLEAALGRLRDGDLETMPGGQEIGAELGRMAVSVAALRQSLRDARAREAAAAGEREAARRAALTEMAVAFETQVSQGLHAVVGATGELDGTAAALEATARSGSEGATAVAGAAEEASANVGAVAASAEELSASIAEVARQVRESAAVARQASEDASGTDAIVRGLADGAQRIGDVVRLIADIAGQTNLLALNATIEAARAGEAGKGFAVVASEVKQLAAQTAKATEQIGGQITAIRDETARAVEAIGGIGRTIGALNEMAIQVAAATEQQSLATQEITRSVAEAAAGTSAVTQHVSSVTVGAAQTGASATQLRAASGQLASQANSLRRDVDGFIARLRAA